VLNPIKPPNRPWQTHNSVFFFKFPHGARVTSIPRQISTLVAAHFHRSHKCVASRHVSADTLCNKNEFSVAIWRFSFFSKWAFATEYSLCRKLALLLRIFHPKKTTGWHMGVAGEESAWDLPPVTCLHLWSWLIGGCSMTSRSSEFGENLQP
jgi:hypothetical protein